jgi:putative tryptophan/tyrosine transport system substrate-binding protein
MRRRDFITVVSTAMAWGSATRAQPAMPVVGFLSSASPERFEHLIAAFREGLQTLGFVEAKNVAIEYRWAHDQIHQLPTFADDLVRLKVRIIVASGGTAPALAAKAATSIIPIVFTAANEPVALGLVSSLNRPGGNVTGIDPFSASLDPKRLELLKGLIPEAVSFAVLTNKAKPNPDNYWRGMEATGRALSLAVINIQVSAEPEFDAAFNTLMDRGVSGVLIAADPLFNGNRRKLVRLATEHRIPAIYQDRAFASIGGLITYGADITGAYRQAGIYTGRILNGTPPAELPVLQPTNFELVLNVRTAKALGLSIPPTLLARADEVIE